MSTQLPQSAFRYIRGQKREGRHPRLETKPTYVERETFTGGERTAIVNTGGGYEHFRTTESGRGVYASHHRLLAIAWNIAHAEDDDPLLDEGNREGVIDTSVLDGMDVHHAAPELDPVEVDKTLGWDNRETCLSFVEHGRHAGMTNANKRAYARDAQKLRDGQETIATSDTCPDCGEPVAATVGDESYCIEHASQIAKRSGKTVEIQ